ncbi:MAG: YccF domain-containing protein [Lactobacillales bacterium]|jgi:uncharacterized membrane protein YccF (DUF307 family)|nr:YccF domain-containing protein [Lactobacillales bacterium]
MSCLGNIIWIIFGGLSAFISWTIAGIICCITIVGFPFGLQCFKIALFSFAPFGKDLVNTGGSISFLANVIWLIFLGWELCFIHLASAFILCITIIGIPFAKQSLKLAKLSLSPFGYQIV